MPVYQYVWPPGYNRRKPDIRRPALLANSSDWSIHQLLIAHNFLNRIQNRSACDIGKEYR